MSSTGYLTYVSEMLSTHDAVVIPGFGGFISKYKPARISDDGGHIFPPTKYIAFNERLDIHDNAFARFIDEQTAAHYSPRLFDHFIANLKADLSNHQVIVIPKVGRLYQDYEGVTHFMPDLLNLNNDTYGLPNVACSKGEWAVDSKMNMAVAEFKEGSLKRAISAAATVALLFLLVWVGTDTLSVDRNRTAELSIVDVLTSGQHLDSATIKEERVTEDQEEQGVAIDSNETVDTPVVVPSQKAIIIVGAFGSAANAGKMINEIESFGYTSYQDKPRKLTRVGVDVSYSTQEELDSILVNVQKRITSRAWILQ